MKAVKTLREHFAKAVALCLDMFWYMTIFGGLLAFYVLAIVMICVKFVM